MITQQPMRMRKQEWIERGRRWLRTVLAAALLAGLLIPVARPAQASAGLPLGLFDPDSTGWYSYRNLTESSFDSLFATLSGSGYILIDIDIDVVNGQRRIGAIWQKNLDGRGWIAHYKKTHDEYSAKWQEYADAGYRVIEQETYVLNGVRYWAGIWVKNSEGYGWASRRNMTSEGLQHWFDTYGEAGLIPVDVDAYPYGSGVRYSAAWVQNSDGIGLIMHHDMSEAQWEQKFEEYRDTMRVMDLEVYVRNGAKTFAAIWVENTNGRGWYSYRDMTYQGFTNRRNQLWDAGYRLVDYGVYYTPGGERRYLGVWRQNNDRPNWPLKDQVTNIVQAHVDAYDVPGMSVAIAHRGKLVYLRGFGDADRENGKWAHSRTVYRLASVSKAIAGILTLLVENQVAGFDLSDATRTWAPALPNHHTHTIGQLVSNRGGIGHYDEHGSVNAQFNTAIAGCDFFDNDPLVYPPGTGYKYSTHGYCLLGAALEGATGDTVDELVVNLLAAPHGLSSLQVENRGDGNENRAQLYKTDNTLAVPDNTSWKELGGGLEASAYDLARMGVKLLDGAILSEDERNTLWTPPDGFSGYALGWSTGTEKGTPVVAKDGAQLGSNTYIRIYPEKEFVIVVLSNRKEGGHSAGQVAKEIGALMLDNEALITPIMLNPNVPILPLLPGDNDPEPIQLQLNHTLLQLVEEETTPDEGTPEATLPDDGDTPMPEDQQAVPTETTKSLYLPMVQP